MPIPPYLWLKDDGGADIKGSVDVQDREGPIEVISMGHGVNLPVDTANRKITGTRMEIFNSLIHGTRAQQHKFLSHSVPHCIVEIMLFVANAARESETEKQQSPQLSGLWSVLLFYVQAVARR